jgi:energy-coupling factor transport system permease protein
MRAETLDPARLGASVPAHPGRDATRAGGLLLGAMAAALVSARPEPAIAAVLAAAVAGAWAGAGFPARGWWLTVGGGLAVAVALNAWLVAGTAIPGTAVAGHAASVEGARLGALLGLRLAGAAAAAHGLRAAWHGERAADEAARWLWPLRRTGVPVERARAVLGLATRVAPLLAEETRRIARLQDVRAGRPARGIAERLTRARATLVPALIGSLERAERLALAMEARHWRMRPLPPRRGVSAGDAAGAALLALALVWRQR